MSKVFVNGTVAGEGDSEMLHPIHETYLVDDGLGPDLALRFMTIPAQSLGRGKVLSPGPFKIRWATDTLNFEETAGALELRVFDTTTPLQVPAALVSTLESRMSDDTGGSDPGSPINVFATRAAMEPFVPMENSPLEAQSLVSIVSRASLGGGAGAVAGLVTTGSEWALLVTVPAGIILCGAAQGIAAALDQGLRYHVLRLMKVPPDTRSWSSMVDEGDNPTE